MGAVNFYLDANVLIALLTPDPFSGRADDFVRGTPGLLVVSDLAAAEFASAVGRRVRMRQFSTDETRTAWSNLDTWVARSAQQVEIGAGDVALATTFLRRLDLTLRTPDALHIAIVQRLDATLVTFDQRRAASARALGMAVATP